MNKEPSSPGDNERITDPELLAKVQQAQEKLCESDPNFANLDPGDPNEALVMMLAAVMISSVENGGEVTLTLGNEAHPDESASLRFTPLQPGTGPIAVELETPTGASNRAAEILDQLPPQPDKPS
jgi:hypothetical protein